MPVFVGYSQLPSYRDIRKVNKPTVHLSTSIQPIICLLHMTEVRTGVTEPEQTVCDRRNRLICRSPHLSSFSTLFTLYNLAKYLRRLKTDWAKARSGSPNNHPPEIEFPHPFVVLTLEDVTAMIPKQPKPPPIFCKINNNFPKFKKSLKEPVDSSARLQLTMSLLDAVPPSAIERPSILFEVETWTFILSSRTEKTY